VGWRLHFDVPHGAKSVTLFSWAVGSDDRNRLAGRDL